MKEVLIGFNMEEFDNYPQYPEEDDSNGKYEKWKRDIEDFAKVEGSKFIRNNFPNIINIMFDELEDDYVKFYCTFKERI